MPYNGGNIITNTEVYIQNQAGTFVKDTTTQVSNSITVPLTTIISTYSLAQGDSIVAQVRMQNNNGWSSLSSSSTNNPLVQVVPHKPSSPPVRVYSQLQPTDTNYGTVLTISCPELSGTDTGGSTITSYQIDYDSTGSGNWITLGGSSPSSLITMYTVTGLTNGQSYYARYRAQNIQGWGPYSDSSSLLVAEVPAKISPAATTANSGTDITIIWTQPTNGGSTITSYAVLFKTSTSGEVSITSCAPSSVSDLTCTVSMSDVITATGLAQGSLIAVRVKALNAVGYSDESDLNISGATVKVKPQAPTTSPTRNSLTSTSQIVVDFGPLNSSMNGGSDITSYALQIQVSGVWQEVIGITSPSLSTTATAITI